jgi:hypothetical protein
MLARPSLALFLLLALDAFPIAVYHLGIDADNWSGQVHDSRFEKSLRAMGVDFISWHIVPEEENDPKRLGEIVDFCRRNHWGYLFNTEIVNYAPGQSAFQHADGTYRYDLQPATLSALKDDPLFLGVVYDEAELMQSLAGTKGQKGNTLQPYFADTQKMAPEQAFLAVSAKVKELNSYYSSYRKRLIFEMVFPDGPFAMTRGGAIVAPKLLKENYNDLMYSVYRGAAIEYSSPELWACVDLWFLDKFPFGGKLKTGYHTPEDLAAALRYSFFNGFDYVYIEQVKALLDKNYQLTDYGRKVIEFQEWRKHHVPGHWRKESVQYYVLRFPDGNWGQEFSPFIPDHPYGSPSNPYRAEDARWLTTLHELSKGVIPRDADTWNAMSHPVFGQRQYRLEAGLPPMLVFDHFGKPPANTKAKVIDLTKP